jgi:choline dehydrogenase-like flavoprotein
MALPKVDVCIVGLGAGGATVAMRLAEAGFSVVGLEAGPHWDPARDFVNDKELMDRKFHWDMPVTFDGDPSEAIVNVTGHTAWGVGGGTNHYEAATPRFHASDFKTYSTDGVGRDWPITYEDLAPSYLMAERQLGVSTPYPDVDLPQMPRAVNPPHGLSYASQVIKKGCDKLGIRSYPGPCAINSRPYDGRPACNYCGFCMAGCQIRANGNTLVTHIPRAMKRGARIRANCYAREVTVDKAGRAASVIYFDPAGREQEQPANIIVLACFSVETPRLMLNSTSSLFPDGIANSSGLVGKNFMTHLTVGTSAIFPEPLDGFRGFPMENLVTFDFYNTDPDRGFARGYKLSAAGGATPVDFANLEPSLWGSELKRHAELYRFYHGMTAIAEALPDDNNTITIDPVAKDKFGVPVARMKHRKSERDAKVIEHEVATMRMILEAAGAKKFYVRKARSGHLMGTTRMGNDPRTSVANSWGQCHDVENLFLATSGLFVTGAAVNPTLTIVALANRTSDYIIAKAKRGALSPG